MLLVDGISKQYGGRLVLKDVTFSVADGAKVALLGPNGSGKSTLARIITGREVADTGWVGGDYAGSGCRYLPQGAESADERQAAHLLGGEAGVLWRSATQLAGPGSLEAELALQLEAQLEEAGGWAALARLEDILRGLNLGELSPFAPALQLSGGERTRLGIAGLLAERGNFMLLDEPSNHLDLEGLVWLEHHLRSFAGGLLLISHDRALVDAVVDTVIELDPANHGARRFSGGYSALLEERGREHERQLAAYRDQQEKIRRTEADIRRVKERAAHFDNLSQNDFWRRRGKKVARIAKVRERRLERMLASDEKLEKPERQWTLKAEITEAARGGDLVVRLDRVALAFGSRILLDALELEVRQGERVVITGANGSGKTTLLRLLLGEQAPDQGEVRLGSGIRVGYMAQQQERLDPLQTPLDAIREAAALSDSEARTFLHRFLFTGDEVFVRNEQLSFGQRARLALGVVVLSGVNLLLLDEPLNHLDISSRERFEEALEQFQGTVVAVSHDRYFMRRFARRLLVLQDRQLHPAEVDSLA